MSHIITLVLQGIHRLYQEGDDTEEVDEGIDGGCEEEDDDEEEKLRVKEGIERDCLGDRPQNKDHSLPERRSRRLKTEASFQRVWCCSPIAYYDI